MITTLSVKNFKAVPYLETSLLMGNHPQGIVFSTDKPNVIVGPNGAGKSALLKALALLTLSNQSGQSAFDSKYLEYRAEKLWEKDWGRREGFDHLYGWEHRYLPGLTAEADSGTALYYRPRHIPGNETTSTHALMCGYSQEAHAYMEATKHKSCGQKSQALLTRMQKVMRGEEEMPGYIFQNWGSYPKKPYSAEELKSCYNSSSDAPEQVNVLLRRLSDRKRKKPVLLMDEPEQSLDAKAQAVLWNNLSVVDCTKMQIITATHSLFPLLYPERFNLIEAVPGYVNEVLTLLKPQT